MTLNRRQLLALSGAAALAAAPSVFAQSAWPTKPVRFVVPFAPGGTSEIVARSVAAELTKQLGQSVYVENKPGGAGVTAMSRGGQGCARWPHDDPGSRGHAGGEPVHAEEPAL
jgi:tripartite-type tricarboxylate transporter receptor subunit TctC